MKNIWPRKIPLWQWDCWTFQAMYVNFWLQVVVISCSLFVKTAISSSDVAPSVLATLYPTSLDHILNLASTTLLPFAVTIKTSAVNSTTQTLMPSYATSMRTHQPQTSQDMMEVLVSTEDMTFLMPALSSSNSVSMFTTIPSVKPTLFSYMSSSVPSAIVQTSTLLPTPLSSIIPTPALRSDFPGQTDTKIDVIKSTIPSLTKHVDVKSASFDKAVVTISPTPSSTLTDLSQSMFDSVAPVSSTVPQVPSTAVYSSIPIPSHLSVLLPSATLTNTPPLMSSQTPAHSRLSTTVPSLSLSPTSSSVFLKPSPTAGSTSHPLTEKGGGGPLSIVQWVGVAVAATATCIILCVIMWWFMRERNTKHKPTYTRDNVTIDYSRSTSTDPKDVWRNSLLLESMNTRIVVPQEDNDEMQATNNPGYEGISDEEEHPNSSHKEVQLTKL